jgi:hypothetical protein
MSHTDYGPLQADLEQQGGANPTAKSNRALCCSLFTLIISIPALIGA